MMKSIRIFSSSNSPQAPSPSSQQEPITSSGDDYSSGDESSYEDDSSYGDKNSKSSSINRPEKLEYLEVPQNPSLLFKFLVYASGGTPASTVKKVTRKVPKRQNSIFDWAFSGQRTQYFWVVQSQCHKKRKGSKNPPEEEKKQAGTGDIATHKEDAHRDIMCDKSVNEKYSQKSVTFDIPPALARKPASIARSRVSAPAPSSSRPAGCTSAATRPSLSRFSSVL
ncbi:hypothetical protein GGI43DRAFT_37596 [Trichoderma evansii]